MVQYLAAVNLLLCALYAAMFLLGRRPFPGFMAISWGATWLLGAFADIEIPLGYGVQEVGVYVVAIGFWLALFALENRGIIAVLLLVLAMAVCESLPRFYLESLDYELLIRLLRLIFVAVPLVQTGVKLLYSKPEEVMDLLFGPLRGKGFGGSFRLEMNGQSLQARPRQVVVLAASSLIGYGVICAMPFHMLNIYEDMILTRLIVGAATAKAFHLVALVGLFLLWSKRVEGLLRRESVSEEVATLAAAIEHDIRTPLSILSQSVALLRRRRVGRIADRIDAQLERIRAAVELLPSFSDARRVALEGGSKVDINRVVSRAVDLALAEVGVPKQRVSVELATENAFVSADERQLVNAVSNLIRNSLEAVVGTQDATVRICVGVGQRTSEVEIVIRDDGGGVDPEVLRRLGEAFVSSKTGESGTRGLGIFVASRLIRFNGGRLEFNSDSKTFTEVKVVLPLLHLVLRRVEMETPWLRQYRTPRRWRAGSSSSDDPDRRRREEASERERREVEQERAHLDERHYEERKELLPKPAINPATRSSFLFIDDDEEFLRATSEWVESATGVKPKTVPSLEKVKDLLEDATLSTIVVDQRLHNTGGVTGEEWILENIGRFRGVKFILLTGYMGDIQDRARLVAAGVEILEKGKDENRLQEILLRSSKNEDPK